MPSGAFGTRGVVDFMMALAAEEIGAVNRTMQTAFPHALRHRPLSLRHGTVRRLLLQNALHGIGCITLPRPYDALPLLLRIVLKADR